MKTTGIKFHEITLEDKEWMDKRFAEDGRNACEYSFANNFIWRKVYHVEVAEICECLVIHFVENGKNCYSYPIGAGERKAAIEKLLSFCQEKSYPLIMSPLSQEDREQLNKWFPEKFLIEENRDDFDYIYAREKLATLSGKKMHGKRNHIARFKDGGDWSYEKMTDENLEECRNMTYSWIRMRSDKWNEEMEEEIMVLHEAFDHRRELGLVGGVLRKNGEIVAFSMGEPLNEDTFVVHFEKAYPEMQGAYPMINQQFVINACEGFDYVNREDDTGDLGLRKAKLSYYPELLLKKYIAIQSDIVYANRETDEKQIKNIWEICFGDEEEYIDFYLKHRMTDENMLVIHEDGKVVSMASFLPVRYRYKDTDIEARYVYAVATLPEYRKRGLAGRILKFAYEHYRVPLILVPADESLKKYYETFGFRTAFPDTRGCIENDITVLECTSNLPQEDVMEPLSAQEYKQIRDEKCAKDGYVQWDEEAIQYAMELCEHYGGKTVAVKNPSGDREILMYEKEGESLNILETTLSMEKLQKLFPYLQNLTGTKRVRYGQMPGMLWLPEEMSDSAIHAEGYLALTLG